jgi:hypothetical protein
MSKTIAIQLSDIHISTCPPARANEPDWFAAMARPLDEVKRLVDAYNCPVLCAGDVFDKYSASPELINWAIDHLPKVIAIPGQHDLPLHSLEDIGRSAFWTLVQANVITPIIDPSDNMVRAGENLVVHGFPYGVNVKPCEMDNDLHVALIHSYVWNGKHHYPGAPKDQNILEWKDRLAGYDVAVFGDNHDYWNTPLGSTDVFNCGCLIPRKSDERKYKPSVGLLHDNGVVYRHFLDCSQDKWVDTPESEPIKIEGGMEEFLDGLRELSADSLDFRQAVNRYMEENDKKIGAQIKAILTEAMED